MVSWSGCRDFITATVPTLESLDGKEITPTDRIRAYQRYDDLIEELYHKIEMKKIKKQEEDEKKRLLAVVPVTSTLPKEEEKCILVLRRKFYRIYNNSLIKRHTRRRVDERCTWRWLLTKKRERKRRILINIGNLSHNPPCLGLMEKYDSVMRGNINLCFVNGMTLNGLSLSCKCLNLWIRVSLK